MTTQQLADIMRRLDTHIAMMAPHQRDRYAGKLLFEARDTIRELHVALTNLMPFALEDYYPNCASPAFKAAVEAAKKLTA